MSTIQLLHMDCMEYMRTLPDRAFDLAIVDPPYGMRGQTFCTKARAFTTADHPAMRMDDGVGVRFTLGTPPDGMYFNELMRISINQVVWGFQYFIPFLPIRQAVVVWDKKNDGNRFSDAELAWTSFDTAVRIFRHWNEPNGDKQQGRIHPTQKPVALYRWLLQNYAKPGDRILDTHGGSMSIAIACDIEGFDLTLCELDKDYFEAGKKRVAAHQAQPRMFAPERSKPEQLSIEPAA